MPAYRPRMAAIGLVAALALAGCGSTRTPSSSNAATTPGIDAVAALGGQKQYDRMMSLYKEAVDAGESKILIYGPEAASLTPVLQKSWKMLFPKIKLEGSQLIGPVLAERMRAENVSGKGIGDIVESGSSFVPGHEEELADIKTFAGSEIQEQWRGPKGVIAVGLLPFGFVYNPAVVAKKDLPQDWADLLTPAWKDRLSIPDPRTGGVMFTSLTAMLQKGIWSRSEVEKLAALKPVIVPPTNFNGVLTSVAQGQRAGGFWVSMPQIREAKGKGAPIDFVFPVKKNNIVGGLFAGVMKRAPSPHAAELYLNWRLTLSGAAASADYGLYSLIDNAPKPRDLPALKPEDFLQPVPFSKLSGAYKESLQIINAAFGK